MQIVLHGEDTVRLITKHGDDAAKAIAKHGEDAVRLITKHGDDAAKAIANHGEDAVGLITKHGDDAAKAIAEHGDEAVELITKHGDDAAKAIANHGEDAVRLITKHGDDAAKAIANHGEDAVRLITKCGDDVAKAIANHGEDAVNALKKLNDDVVSNAAKLINNYGENTIGLIEKYGGKYGNDLIDDLDYLFNSVTKVTAKNSLESIGEISMKHSEYMDDTVKSVAQELKKRINSGIIRKNSGGKLEESVVTVAIDKSNGRMFYGISGPKSSTANPLNNPTRRLECHEDLKPFLERCVTHYDYPLDNCGEYNVINNALNNGSNKSDLRIYSIYISSGNYAEPCLNCQELYMDFATFILWRGDLVV